MADIKVDEFEEMNNKMEGMAKEMQKMDDEWKAERQKFEAQRAEDAKRIQELSKRKKRKWYQIF